MRRSGGIPAAIFGPIDDRQPILISQRNFSGFLLDH